MRRLAALVFCGASVAYAAWVIVPTRSSVSYRPLASSASTATDVAALDKELARFDARHPAPSAGPTIDRDPFGYAVPPRPVQMAPVVAPPPAPLPAPAPVLPRLIAISTKTTPAGPVRTAAFSTGDRVLLAHLGDTVGALVVHTIDDSAVELVDPTTGAAYRIR